MQPVASGLQEISGDEEQQLFQIGVECGIAGLLHAHVCPHRHRRRLDDHGHRPLSLFAANVRRCQPSVHWHLLQFGADLFPASCSFGQKHIILPATCHNHGKQSAQQKGISAGAQRKMQIGQISNLGAARIDHDHAATRVFPYAGHCITRADKAVRHPRIAAEHDGQLRAVHILCRVDIVAAEHMPVDPEIAGLFLADRAEIRPAAHHAAQGLAKHAAHHAALAATTIIAKGLLAAGITHRV